MTDAARFGAAALNPGDLLQALGLGDECGVRGDVRIEQGVERRELFPVSGAD